MSDIFRKEYKTLSKENMELITSIKTKAKELYDLYSNSLNFNRIREMDIATGNLETSVMWAIKGITE